MPPHCPHCWTDVAPFVGTEDGTAVVAVPEPVPDLAACWFALEAVTKDVTVCVVGEAALHEPEPLLPDGIPRTVLLVIVENVVGRALPGACPGVVDFVVSVRKVGTVLIIAEEDRDVVVTGVIDELMLGVDVMLPGATEADTVAVTLVVVFVVDVDVDDLELRS